MPHPTTPPRRHAGRSAVTRPTRERTGPDPLVPALQRLAADPRRSRRVRAAAVTALVELDREARGPRRHRA